MYFLHLCLVAVIFTAGALAVPYSPECQALDEMIRQVSSPLPADGVMACNRSRECTGLTCALTYQSSITYMTLDIHQCRSPPSMDFRMFTSDGTYNFERTVTHGDKFEIVDLSEVPGLSTLASFMHVYIQTDFERVQGGLIIGITLLAGMSEELILYEQPILQDHMVPTPPCINGPHLAPSLREEQCKHMEGLMEDLPNQGDFDCTKNSSCMAFSCSGSIDDLRVSTYVQIDNCDDPVSLTIYLNSTNLTFPWQHTFTESETVEINDFDYIWNGFPVVIRVKMEMEPPEDGYMLTSLTYIGCANSVYGLVCPDYIRVKILDNSEIPVPPCHPDQSASLPPPPPPSHRPHFPTYPTSAPHPECKAFDDIIRQMTRQIVDEHMMTCTRNNNCTSMNCTALYAGDDYEIYFGVHHCQDPIQLVIALRSHTKNINWQKTFTHGETVPIEGLSTELPFLGKIQMYLQVEMTKEAHDLILSMFIVFGKSMPGDVSLPRIPLVENEDIPLPPCDGSTRPPPPPPPHGGTVPPEHAGTGKPLTLPPGGRGRPDNLHGETGGTNSPHTTSIVVAVVLAVVVVIGVIAALLVLRRFRCMKYGGTRILLDSKSENTSVI